MDRHQANAAEQAARRAAAKLQRSTDALKIELDKLRFETNEVANPQVAA